MTESRCWVSWVSVAVAVVVGGFGAGRPARRHRRRSAGRSLAASCRTSHRRRRVRRVFQRRPAVSHWLSSPGAPVVAGGVGRGGGGQLSSGCACQVGIDGDGRGFVAGRDGEEVQAGRRAVQAHAGAVDGIDLRDHGRGQGVRACPDSRRPASGLRQPGQFAALAGPRCAVRPA